ncbi:ribose-5-phosphate isomerase RKI1 [Apiospora kogelbergensis]|uniref:ribose-5-phosphate isomerase RKI1 n=1 Tax=Apiospora kogelbergensis TaxID=1337665 RepID=UPI00313070E9
MSSSKSHAMEPPPPPPVTMAGDLVESAKRAAAQHAVRDHLKPDYTHIGIGSGSTIKYVVETIADMPKDTTSKMKFVPTGSQSRDLILDAKLPLLTIETLVLEKDYVPGQQYLDVCFDGADEVDPELNCIKGGGACHFQEKIVAVMSKRFICVADYRKKVPNLLTGWPGIPIEVHPSLTEYVRRKLIDLGSRKPYVRSGLPGKAGPIVTDNGFHVIDAPFPPLLLNSEREREDPSKGLYTVETLGHRISEIKGVLEIGLFSGPTGPEAKDHNKDGGEKPVMVYFGMQDGSVQSLEAKVN